MPAPSPPPEENDRAFSTGEPAVVWRAYARQMLAILGVDNPAIEAAYAAVPREAFLGPPPWTASSPFGGIRPLPGADPVILYQDLVIGLDPAHGVNNPPGAARQAHRGPRPEARRAHRPAGAGYYSAILAELVGPSGRVTAVEFDAALAERAESFFSGRTNVRVVCDDGARNPSRRRLCQFRRVPAGRSLGRRLVAGRPSRLPARRPGPAAAEFRRPAQRPQRGAQDRTARRRQRGARNQHCLFCLRRRRIRG